MKKLVFVLGFIFPICVQAETGATSGSCGAHCSWVMEGNTLKVTGYGDINGYGTYQTPWYWNRDNITKIEIINESDTQTFKNIGTSAFHAMAQVTEVVLPEGIETIGGYAFHFCHALTTVDFPSTLKEMGRGAFNYTHISDFVVPENVVLGDYALGSTFVSSVVISGSTNLTAETLQHTGDWLSAYMPEHLNTIYCELTNESCQNLLDSEIADKVKVYTIEDDTGICKTSDGKFFASIELMAKGKDCACEQICKDIVSADQNGQAFMADGKFYASLDDWAKGHHIKKRIYTIDEANKVAGDKNMVKIKYR